MRRGFTLLETALATVIVGVGILSMMALFGACTTQNRTGTQMTTAMMLGNNVQEMLASLPFHDPTFPAAPGGTPPSNLPNFKYVDDYAAYGPMTISPPVDSFGNTLNALSQFTQKIVVLPVNPYQLNANTNEASPNPPATSYTGAARVRVHIYYQSTPTAPKEELCTMSWIRVDQ
jgi:type II secretory pathway pseudopilin PulG